MRAAAKALAALTAAWGASIALAQQPPAFAPPNVTQKGAASLAANCAACHGTQGRPAAGSPLTVLAGRPAGDLVQIMTQYKEGKRPATLMHQIAKGYSDTEIAAMADYFSKQR